ncbi:Na+/H+ antiporter subunit A [Nocardia gamkensis]|uniref:Na+/H+ antiporter subunit A n=1 Tax=Nocardia gamkensis TaxID=352869 RepID=A0A7X6L3V1_9NOCA|nr:Na+/H+ antiporter subunit A [Nocardia gamkensis]NKY27288.1 Na+/H+ antiporter subunit A [Nocardia gamkensis]NQE65811.1 putative antiporter subunit mnhA2 [Nocardia gamkensis]
MLAILLVHAAAALVAPLGVRALGRNAFYLLAAVPLGSSAWVIANWSEPQRVRLTWAPSIGLNIDLRFDTLAAILCLLVLGIGALVLVYCARYFENDEPRLGVFAAELVAFAGAMFGLVTSDNMVLLYVFWEATTVLSFLLIGHNAEQAASRRAAIQALLVTGAGGLAMLAGIVVLGTANGSYLLSDLLSGAPSGTAVDVAVALLLVGALTKSAVVPLHFWLPGAMAAPTPVSAYLHAAAMVKAGVYLIARLAPAFAQNPVWHPMVLTLGLASMLLAGLRALQVVDLKLVLAFGTVSQLGFLIVLVGLGTPAAALAGVTMIVAHALFKASLFLVVGIIDHGAGTRDLRRLSGLGRRAPVLCATAILAALSMAGIPPLLGFVGKESALSAVLDADILAAPARGGVFAGVVLGSMLTVGYSIRFVWGAFADKGVEPDPAPGAVPPAHHPSEVPFAGRESEDRLRWHPPGALFLAAPVILAAASLAAGLAPSWLDARLRPYAETFAGPPLSHLALWHGFTPVPAWTLLIVAVGVGLYRLRARFTESAHPRLGNADRAYDATLRAMDTLSLRMTGTVQRGSLPLSQAAILVTLIILPTVLLALGTRTGVTLRLWDSPLQAAVGVIMAVTAIAATVLRNRLASVLVVGVTGYGSGVIFALHGAPDLALTQFLVETLTLVIFVLVLRAFPARIEARRRTAFKIRRAILAAGTGTVVAVLAGFAVAARTAEPVWPRIPEAAYTFGGGKNALNVLLVDLRAWDTLGEISVLVVAATGVASLVFRSRRFGSAPRAADSPDYDPELVSWLPAGRLVDRADRSMVLQITTRLVFPTIMVLSVYFFFSGHNAPGGGFAGGLTAGLALTLRYLAGGRYELGEALPVDAGHVLGAGLTLAAGTAVSSLLLGAPPLSSAIIEVSLPVVGHIKVVTALLFDLGVYLIVVGLVLDVLRSLGARLDSELADADTPATKGGSGA